MQNPQKLHSINEKRFRSPIANPIQFKDIKSTRSEFSRTKEGPGHKKEREETSQNTKLYGVW